jgi:hypothetical protein
MPSSRKQLNVRMDDVTQARVDRLLPIVSAAVGLDLSMSDLFRLAMIELERRYATAPPVTPSRKVNEPPPTPKRRKDP